MPTRILTAALPHPLYRIGRARSPLAFAPWDRVGEDRFDDPLGEYRVLYTGERVACFLEALASFRPPANERQEHLTGLLNNVRCVAPAEVPPYGRVPADWFVRKRLSTLSIGDDPKILDLRVHGALTLLESDPIIAEVRREDGRAELDVSNATGLNRIVTRAISRWAFEHAYDCILYACRFDSTRSCVAIIEDASILPENVSRIRRNDVNLQQVITAWNMKLPELTLLDHLKAAGHDCRRYLSIRH